MFITEKSDTLSMVTYCSAYEQGTQRKLSLRSFKEIGYSQLRSTDIMIPQARKLITKTENHRNGSCPLDSKYLLKIRMKFQNILENTLLLPYRLTKKCEKCLQYLDSLQDVTLEYSASCPPNITNKFTNVDIPAATVTDSSNIGKENNLKSPCIIPFCSEEINSSQIEPYQKMEQIACPTTNEELPLKGLRARSPMNNNLFPLSKQFENSQEILDMRDIHVSSQPAEILINYSQQIIPNVEVNQQKTNQFVPKTCISSKTDFHTTFHHLRPDTNENLLNTSQHAKTLGSTKTKARYAYDKGKLPLSDKMISKPQYDKTNDVKATYTVEDDRLPQSCSPIHLTFNTNFGLKKLQEKDEIFKNIESEVNTKEMFLKQMYHTYKRCKDDQDSVPTTRSNLNRKLLTGDSISEHLRKQCVDASFLLEKPPLPDADDVKYVLTERHLNEISSIINIKHNYLKSVIENVIMNHVDHSSDIKSSVVAVSPQQDNIRRRYSQRKY